MRRAPGQCEFTLTDINTSFISNCDLISHNFLLDEKKTVFESDLT